MTAQIVAAISSAGSISSPPGNTDSKMKMGFGRQPQADLVDVAAPDRLPEALEKIGDPERRHEQDDPFLIDETAQHQELDRIGKRDHDRDRQCEREDERHELGEPRERQRGEQHHRALREVEHARGLEDQHEAERDQRVEHAGQKPADQRFQHRADHGALSPLRQRPQQRSKAASARTRAAVTLPVMVLISMAHAEIGLDHGLVALDLGRRTVGDLDAVIEHDTRSDRSITTPMSCSISAMVVP